MAGGQWSQCTPYLLFCVFVYSWGDLMFGIDTGSFGSLQVLPSWLRTFGDYDAENDRYFNPTSRVSIMNSVVFAGKLVGTMAFEPIAERIGYRNSMYLSAVIQCIAIVVELTAKDWVVFTVGRIIAYLGIGIVENAAPAYCSEISPAGLRGFMTGSMTVLVTGGNLWGAGMSRAYATETEPVGWMVPVGIQLLPAVMILALVPFTPGGIPESPRYSVAKGRSDVALKALDRLRKPRDVASGMTMYEVQAFEQAIEESRTTRQGRWVDLFRGTFLRRTVIVSLLFWFYQSTGVQFVNTYGPTQVLFHVHCVSPPADCLGSFYNQMGLGELTFTYTVIAQAIGMIGTLIGILATDRYGRRPPIIIGAAGSVLFNFLVAGLGSQDQPSAAAINTVVASVILLLAANKVSFQCNSFLMASEIGGPKMRRKFMGFGTSVDVVSAFIVTFTLPYLLRTPGANLGPKVGYVMGGLAILSLIFAVFFVPEIAGRALEEMDELFEMRLWAWQFKGAKTAGVGARVAEIEAGREITHGKTHDDDTGMQELQPDEKASEERVEDARGEPTSASRV